MEKEETSDIETLLACWAFDGAPIAQVVLDPSGGLALCNERAVQMFQLVAGSRGKSIALCYPPTDLHPMIEEVRLSRKPVRRAGVERALPSGETQYLDIETAPLVVEGEVVATFVAFTDVTRRHLRLETLNEELQSANDELETLNEELQSANDELETLNQELRESEQQLARTHEFLTAVLGSSRAGVAVIGKDLRVRVWNERAEELWGLRADEVYGNLFVDLDVGLLVGKIAGPLTEAMRSGQTRVLELEGVNRRGQAIRCSVTINPVGRNARPDAVTLLMEEVVRPEAS